MTNSKSTQHPSVIRRVILLALLLTMVTTGMTFNTPSAYADCAGTLCDGNADPCNQGTACEQIPGWEDEFRSVVKLVTYSSAYSTYSHGTGVLINNVNNDGTPYILTAAHVLDLDDDDTISNAEISEIESSMNVVFGYHQQCGDPSVTSYAGIETGVTVLDWELEDPFDDGGEADFALLLLNLTVIPESYDPYFVGWDIDEVAPNNGVHIHHPNGDAKQIAKAAAGEIYYTTLGDAVIMVDRWEIGATEHGSSGGPLFSADTHNLLGVLLGDYATPDLQCSGGLAESMFSAFWRYKIEKVSGWLGNVASVPGYDPYAPGEGGGAGGQTYEDTIEAGDEVTVIAPEIHLKPGFWAQAGSYFHALGGSSMLVDNSPPSDLILRDGARSTQDTDGDGIAGGEHTEVTINLGAAVQKDTKVWLTSADRHAALTPLYALVRAGESQVNFSLIARYVDAETQVEITAMLGSQAYTTDVTVQATARPMPTEADIKAALEPAVFLPLIRRNFP